MSVFLYMEDINNCENLIITKNQMERILGRKFKNTKHWELFQDHFLYRPKPSLFELYRWSEMEYEEVISRC